MALSVEALEREFREALECARGDDRALERLRVEYLGRKGKITQLLRELGQLPAASRPAAGRAIHALQATVAQALEQARAQAREAQRRHSLERSREDITLPGRRPWSGALHPVSRTRRTLERIFRDMGYEIVSGPEVEDDFHNFRALNLPPEHPARDETDTFYLGQDLLLRTHTSPVQIRTMRQRRPPIRIICTGRVYRRDLDATHLPMFHQLEALVVGEGISMAHLKGTMDAVWKRFFGPQVSIRLRPGYFPFVEPGAEYDVSCALCDGRGCRTCKGTGWIELGGAGMVHPAVLETVGIDPERYTGFAFGLGIDRIAMIHHGIEDLRLLVEGDVRFLSQFSF